MEFIDTSENKTGGFIDSQDVYGPEFVRPPNVDNEAILKGNETPEEASERINSQASMSFKRKVTKAIDNKEDTIELAEVISDGENKLFGIYSKDDLYIEDDVLSRSEGYTASETRYYKNLQILTEEMEQAAVEQEGKSYIGYGIDLIDREILRATAFGWYENLTNRTAREGDRLLSTMFDTADPKEMRRFAKEYVDDIRKEGLGKENAFAYAQMVREVYGKGYNPDAAWDKIFGTLDLLGFVGVVGKTAGIARSISKAASLKSTTVATRAGNLGGIEEANKVADNLHSKDIDPLNTANLQSSAVDLNGGGVRPSTGWSQKIKDTSDIIKTIIKGETTGAVPTAARIVDQEALKVAAVEKFTRTFKYNLYDTRINELDTQTSSIDFLIGKGTDGTAFKPLKSGEAPSGAKRIAEKTGGEVVPLDPDNLSLGYVVKVSEAVDLSSGLKGGLNIKLVQSLWTKTFGKLYDNNLIASAATRDVAELNTLALRSQSASKYLAKEGEKKKKIIAKLNYDDTSMLDGILTELRDGPKSILRKEWSETDFKSKWVGKTDEQPSQEVLDAFRAAQDLSDAAYFFRSQEVLKSYISKGFKNSVEVTDGIFLPARRTTLSKLPDDAKVLDNKNGVKLYAKEVDDIPQDTVVWELNSPWNGQDYVLLPSTIRVIEPSDVLGYSAYGRRTNPLAKYFLFLTGEKGVKTILTAFSDQTAQLATKELQAIQAAYKTDKITDESITEVIQANNSWSPSINTKADMDKWLTDNKIDITEGKVGSKLRDDTIEDPFDKVFNGENVEEYVHNQMARSDTPLTEYGGSSAYNPSPLSSIVDQYGTAAHQYASSVYTHRAMQGWIDQVRLMKKEGVNIGVEVGQGSNFKKLFLTTKVTGSSPAAKRMRYLQDTIKRRLGMTSDLQDKMKVVADEITEQVYDAWGLKVNLEGSEALLLKTGFFSAFSFNLSQAYLQSSQIINSAAILGYEVASRALVGSTILRKVMSGTDDIATESLGLKRLAKAIKLSEEDTIELAELFRQVLPNEVMGDSIELGTGVMTGKSSRNTFGRAGFKASKVGKAIFNVGLKPFNFGESTAKSNGFVGAALEFKKANPNVSLLSEDAINYIATRSETLTQNMSNTSRSALQSGVGKVPTQWLSYFFRTTEQVFVGRDLTKAERAKLGFITMPFFGFTGLGGGFLAEKVAETFDLDPNDDTDKALFITMKYGVMDGFLNHFTPFDVALSERMAPIPAVYDIYDKFTEENVLTAIGGPSGSIVYTGGEALFNLVNNLVNGQTSTLTEDSLRILRNFSGINSVAKAAGIIADDTYRNRKGLRVPVEVGLSDALISILGFTPLQVTEYYNQMGRVFDLGKNNKALKKEVLSKSKLAWSIYGKDPERASEILRDARTIVSKAPISYNRKTDLLRLLTPTVDDYSFILRTYYENDKGTAARWALPLLQKD